jgi:type III secretory pathway component EscU
MILFGWKLKNEKRPPSILKSIFPLINFSLYLFKTIFQIPIMTVIFISLMTSYKQNIGVDTGSLGVLLGVLNLILFIIMQLYLITSFKDSNPFSDLIHAG